MLFIKLIVVLAFLTSISNPEIVAVRQQYELAEKSKEHFNKFIVILNSIKTIDAITKLGYEAAREMIAAAHTMNPLNKLKYFNNGKEILESAILANKDNIELHYLRFTLQEHSPSILGYKGKMKEDKSFLMQHISEKLKQTDSDLFERITLNFLKSDYLNSEEKTKLKSVINQINKQ
jgi:hypothetical protein